MDEYRRTASELNQLPSLFFGIQQNIDILSSIIQQLSHSANLEHQFSHKY